MGDLLLWLLVAEAVGLLAFPAGFCLLKRLPDRGYTVAKVLGLLTTGYVVWLLGSLGMAPFTQWTVLGVLLALALPSGWLLWRRRVEMAVFIRREGFHLLVAEVVFLAAFLAWALIITQAPGINHTEKPMDFGFLNTLLRSESFPPEDFWLAGNAVNYYYGGHLMMAVLAKVTGIGSHVAYNLSMALIPALAAAAVYGLVYNLVRLAGVGVGRAVVFGLAAPLLVLCVSNLVGVLEFVQARGWGSGGFWQWVAVKDLVPSSEGAAGFFPEQFNWWWRSTRVISTYADGQALDYTITEFPFFSFLLGDLHAHVMSLPFLALTLAFLLNLLLCKSAPGLEWVRRRPWEAGALALSIGAAGFINTWDLPVYVTLFGAVALLLSIRHHGPDLGRATRAALGLFVPVAVAAVALFLPFYLSLESDGNAVLPLRDVSSRPFHFLLVWGLLLAVAGSMIARQLWSLPRLGRSGHGLLSLTLIVSFLPFMLWAVIALPLEAIESGLWPAAAQVGSRALKIAPLMALVGAAMYGALARAREGPISLVFALSMAAMALYLLMGAELFHVEDFLPLRMNTVFKLYYQSWLLLGLAAAFGVYHWVSQPAPKRPALRFANYAWMAVVGLLLVGSLYYPAGAALDRTRASQAPPTLDGLAYLERYDGDEYRAINALRDGAPTGTLVEAVGEPYSEHGRVSAATGLPSVLNWPGHQVQWRGSNEPLGSRREDVAAIYRGSSEEAARLLDKYNVRYVYLGDRERAAYGPIDEEKFLAHMRVYLRRGDVVVFERAAP